MAGKQLLEFSGPLFRPFLNQWLICVTRWQHLVFQWRNLALS